MMKPAENLGTYGSPITKLSPALMDGIKPKDPTSAAAASLLFEKSFPLSDSFRSEHSRQDVAIEVGRNHYIEDPRAFKVKEYHQTYRAHSLLWFSE